MLTFFLIKVGPKHCSFPFEQHCQTPSLPHLHTLCNNFLDMGRALSYLFALNLTKHWSTKVATVLPARTSQGEALPAPCPDVEFSSKYFISMVKSMVTEGCPFRGTTRYGRLMFIVLLVVFKPEEKANFLDVAWIRSAPRQSSCLPGF